MTVRIQEGNHYAITIPKGHSVGESSYAARGTVPTAPPLHSTQI